MLLLFLQVWLGLTVLAGLSLALVVGLQALVRAVRRLVLRLRAPRPGFQTG